MKTFSRNQKNLIHHMDELKPDYKRIKPLDNLSTSGLILIETALKYESIIRSLLFIQTAIWMSVSFENRRRRRRHETKKMSLAVKASSLDTFFIFNLKVDSFNHFLTLWVMKQPMVIMVKGTYIHQRELTRAKCLQC